MFAGVMATTLKWQLYFFECINAIKLNGYKKYNHKFHYEKYYDGKRKRNKNV